MKPASEIRATNLRGRLVLRARAHRGPSPRRHTHTAAAGAADGAHPAPTQAHLTLAHTQLLLRPGDWRARPAREKCGPETKCAEEIRPPRAALDSRRVRRVAGSRPRTSRVLHVRPGVTYVHTAAPLYGTARARGRARKYKVFLAAMPSAGRLCVYPPASVSAQNAASVYGFLRASMPAPRGKDSKVPRVFSSVMYVFMRFRR